MPASPDLTVVTNGLRIADALHGAAGVEVILTGGVRTPSDALVGPVADATLASLRVDRTYLGVHGLDASGLTTPNLAEAATDRALMACAAATTVLADHTKWGVVGLARIAPLDDVDTLLTDDALPADARRHLTGAALRLGHHPGSRHRDRTDVRMTPTTLADGRELIYFDDSEPYVSGGATRTPRRRAPAAGPVRARASTRTASPQPVTGPELRRDPLTGEWIPMAAHRMNRTFLPPADANPLAPAKPGAVYQDGEIPAEDYDVVVFENRFPSLLAVPGIPDAPVQRDGEPLWTVRPAAGRCEVICFSSDSTASLSTVTPRRMRTIVEAWTQRTEALSALPGIEQVFVFENRGKEIGVTLHHPHGQIYAFPYVTPRTTAMLARGPRAPRADRPPAGPRRAGRRAGARRADRRWSRSTGWPTCRSRRAGPSRCTWPRGATCPTCRRSPTPSATTCRPSTWRCCSGWTGSSSAPTARRSRCRTSPAGTRRPSREGRDVSRLHLQLFSVLRAPGKLKYLAGVESGMGAWISDTTPERIATRLQELA